MDAILKLFGLQGNPYGIYFVFIPVFVIFFLVVYIFQKKAIEKSNNKFLESNPNAVKVYGSKSYGIKEVEISVSSVNGEYPESFVDGMKTGVYVNPGEVRLGVSYYSKRPGVLHKNVVSTTSDNLSVVVEANKEYKVDFDNKNKIFTFSEL